MKRGTGENGKHTAHADVHVRDDVEQGIVEVGRKLPPVILDPATGKELYTEEHILKLAQVQELFEMYSKLISLKEPWELSEGTVISIATSLNDVRHLLNVALFGDNDDLFL